MDLPRTPPFASEMLPPGLWIAPLAIIHLFLAQLALGGGLLITFFEWQAKRQGEELLREFLHRIFTTLVLITFVSGVICGIAVWLTLALVAPRGLLLLVREFHWLLAAAWVFLCLQVAAGTTYWMHGRFLSYRRRLAVAAAFALAAWLSLFWVNGVLSFQLTPGGWIDDGGVWAGFFNRTLWPMIAGRTIASITVAALAACIAAHTIGGHDPADRADIVRAATPLLVPLLLMPGAAVWFLCVARGLRGVSVTGAGASITVVFLLAAGVSFVLGGLALITLRGRRAGLSLPAAILLLALAFIATTATELLREGLRKPFLVSGALYSNGVLVEEGEELRRVGVEAFDTWPLRDEDHYPAGAVRHGRRVHRLLCAACHAPRGLNGLLHLSRRWDREMLLFNLRRLDRLKPCMPPFCGSDADLEALADYLLWLREEG
ncbi:MAG: c-type cytochrome [Planctomycetota bacterium]